MTPQSSLLFVLSAAVLVVADPGVPTASISTHVLDIDTGVPAAGVQVLSYIQDNNGWSKINSQFTGYDGRVPWVTQDFTFVPGTYKIVFRTHDYYKELGKESFYPEISVSFNIKDATQHYHVPITLSPYGYSTYRGS